MTADIVSALVAVLALGISVYALVQSRKFNELDQKFKAFSAGDLKARQAPRIQVSDELLQLEKSRQDAGKGDAKRQLKVKYSAVLQNKGSEVAEIKSAKLQITPIDEKTGELKHGIGALIIGAVYLAPGESLSISKEIGGNYLHFVREFFGMSKCPLLIRCVYRYAGYAGRELSQSIGLLKLNKQNIIQSYSNWKPPTKQPRSYPLNAHGHQDD